ncbi:hypothetical protein CAPI_00305 [Corynebacterium capitovis DSM 44611]|nr:hypothetical protein [Corynebacterium capitovis]WKD56648.1 hypothetical protein CAPI_00305 [Corynebacterium capitovis DSM 44611]
MSRNILTIALVVAVAFVLSEGRWLGPVVALAASLLALFSVER